MSKVSHLPKNVPSKELPFKIKTQGSVNKSHTYEGDFVVKVPTGRDFARMGVELAKLNDGIPNEMMDRDTGNLNNAIAFLKVCLVQAPKWFTNAMEDEHEEGMDYGLDTLDINVPMKVFKESQKKIKEWKDSLSGQPKEQ